MKNFVAIIACLAIALSFIAGCDEGVNSGAPTAIKGVKAAGETAAKTMATPALETASAEKAVEKFEVGKCDEVKAQAEEVKPEVKAAEEVKAVPAEIKAVPSTKEIVEARHQQVKEIQAAAKAEDEKKIEQPKAEEPIETEKPAAETNLEGVEVIVNGEAITTEQVKEEIKPALDQIDQQLPANVRDFYKAQEIKKAAQMMIDKKLIEDEIEMAGIKITDADIEEFITKGLADANMTREQLVEEVASKGMTLEQWKEQMGFDKMLAFNKLTEKDFEPQLNVDPNEVRNFYVTNPQYFNLPEMVEARHILVKTDKNADPNVARAKAEGILSEIKTGTDFDELANKYTDKQGEIISEKLAYFPKEKMVEPFANVAFAMEVGQISDVVQTRFGYHIIKLTGHKDQESVTFEKAEKSITEFLKMQKRQQLENAYKAKLRETADIVYPPGKEPVAQRPGMPMGMRPQPGNRPAARPAASPSQNK